MRALASVSRKRLAEKHKVPLSYSHALPIHAKSGRESGPESARSLTAVGMTALLLKGKCL
jgi:hypothetical protein